MSVSSTRSSRSVRRTVRSLSRRGLQFVRRATMGGVVAASVFAASDSQAQVNIPPDAMGTAGDTAGSSSFGNQTITFNGAGTLTLKGTGTTVNNALSVRWFDTEFGPGFLNPIQSLIGATSEGSTVLTTGPLNYRDDAAFGANSAGLTSFETFSGLWQGFMNVTTAGNYILTTESDDGSAWWVDLNRNAVFEPNEFVLNSQNQDQGATTRSATITGLQPGTYEIAIGYYENGGGNVMRAAIQRPGETAANNINPAAAAQNNFWSYSNNRTASANFTTNPVVLNASGTISVDNINAQQAQIGTLTMAPGTTLTTTGAKLVAGPLTTTGGTVGKAGTGTLSLVPGTAVAAGTTISVNQGTLEITNTAAGTTSINGAPVTMAGGTLLVNVVPSEGAPVPGWLGRFYNLPANGGSDAVLTGTALDARTPTQIAISPEVNFPSSGANPFASIGVTVNGDDHASQFVGKINITAADNYQFSTESDDGSVMWLDFNNDGDFVDAGEEIVNNRGLHGMVQVTSAAIPLTPGEYRLKVEHFERGGGSGIIARYAQGGGALAVIPQTVMSANPLSAPDYGSNITVTENSTIQSAGAFAPQFGDLSIAAGKTLTLAGAGARFDNVNLSAGTVTINTTGNSVVGHLSDAANTGVVLNKAGAANLVLDDPTNDIDGTTINVQAGNLQVINNAAGGNPLGGSLVQLSGGTLLLDTRSTASSVALTPAGYTARLYNLAAGSGSDAVLGGFLNTQVPVETVPGVMNINFDDLGANTNPFASIMTNPAALQLEDHASQFTGQFTVGAAEVVGFFTSSDDGSVMWVDLDNDGNFEASEEVVNNRGLHGPVRVNGARFLTPGTYNIRVEQYERGGGSQIIAGFTGNPTFDNDVNVTANSTINVAGTAAAATIDDINMSSGVTLTKSGGILLAGDVNTAGNGTLTTNGDMLISSISDGTNSGTFTKNGAGTLTVRGAGDLSGTTLNVTNGTVIADANDSLANAVGINISGGAGVRASTADAISVGTPITVARASYVDFDAPLTSSRKITVDAFGAVKGQFDNLSYGTGAGQVGLVNNSVLAPDAGETNLPAPGPAGNRLLLGITANDGTYAHGTEVSTGPTDLYRGVAIGGWTDPGALAATLNGPVGGDLNIHIVAATAQMPGNLTLKTINPLATQFNSQTGTVNMLGQGRVIINGGGPIGGTWTRLNRTGDPTFLGANNVVLELGGGVQPTIAGGQHVMIRHGSFNLPGGGGANTTANQGTVNILEGGTIIMDDAVPNQPSSGIFNVTGTAGTQIVDPAFGIITDINGDGIGDAADVSAGPGAVYTNQTTTVLSGAVWNTGPGFLLVIDNDNAINGWSPVILQNADYILDDAGADTFAAGAFILGNGRRLTTSADSSSDINDNTGGAFIVADPTLATTPGAKVILSAAEARTLDLNNRGTDRQPNFAGITLQIGDSSPFTTTQGLNTDSGRAFDQLRVGRVTRAQTGQVRLAGARAREINVASGFARFEDDVDVLLINADGTPSTGNFTVQDGTLYVEAGNNAQPILRNAILAGNLGRVGSEVRLEDGAAFKVRLTRAVHTVPQIIRTTTAGTSYLVLQEGELPTGGSGNTDANFTNVTLANGSTLDLGLHGGNTFLRANINATAGGGGIENNASNTNIVVNVNAGAQPIRFTGSRFTNLGGPVTASAINLGNGVTRSGRLSVSNLANIGSLPITISPFSQLGFNPGTGNTIAPNLAQITQGSGAIRAQNGTVDFGTSVVTGSTVAATAPVAGLQHSILSGSNNFGEANANTDTQLGVLAAKTPFNEATFAAGGAFGQVNTTHVYTGQFFDADGIVAFGENFDDSVFLVVDGRTLLNNTAAGTPTASPDDDAATPGLQTLIGMGPGGDGWHNFEVRLSQGTGGVGTTLNNGWVATQAGFGFNPDPGTSITNPLAGSNYTQELVDNGSMNLFRYTTNAGAGDLIVDAGATMSMGGFANQDSLALNGSATGTANLTLVNSGLTNTLQRTNVTGLGAVDVAAGSTLQTGALTMANSATLTKLGGGTATINGAQSNGTGTTLTASAGTLNINTDAGSAAARNTTVNANSTTNFGSTQHLAALNVGPGATATVTAGGPKNVVTNALTIDGGATPTGKLDVTDNAVIVDYPAAGPSPDATIRDQIISGRGGSGLNKTWNGQGITSSTAGAAPVNSMSVGYAVNGTLPLTVYSNFRGEAVDPSSVLIRFTRTADANLDGVVNNDDVAVVGANYAPGSPKPRWDLGDFDYNGFVDNDDITLLGAFYNPGATPIPAPAESSGVAAVPEPASWLMLTIGGLGAGLFGWRRRRTKK